MMLVSDMSILNIDSRDDQLNTLLDQVLSLTDVRIIRAIIQIRRQMGKTPAAADIQKRLSKSYRLKKNQLYERLNRLTRLGFLSVKLLPRPRRYNVNRNTITKGAERWIEEQRASVANLSVELKMLQQLLDGLNSKSVASAITEKLSLDYSMEEQPQW
jgi:DNA-binding PadR family transcriptional regulator